eukprot:5090700-Alexandrium_andersonii.AAC.1
MTLQRLAHGLSSTPAASSRGQLAAAHVAALQRPPARPNERLTARGGADGARQSRSEPAK